MPQLPLGFEIGLFEESLTWSGSDAGGLSGRFADKPPFPIEKSSFRFASLRPLGYIAFVFQGVSEFWRCSSAVGPSDFRSGAGLCGSFHEGERRSGWMWTGQMGKKAAGKSGSRQAQSGDGAASQELDRLRTAIDAVDGRILESLNERAKMVQQVGALKQGSQVSPVYVASRERDLVSALRSSNTGPFPDAAIAPVFREIVSATRSLEERVRVAFLGPEGTFSHQAVVTQFGSQVDLCPVGQLEDVVKSTERGDAHFGVIPLENSIDGAVNPTFDALMESDITICGEVMVRVSQNLLSKSGRAEDIVRVASIPQAVSQCRNWLRHNLPSAEVVDSSSTAAAAKWASEDETVAAIGSSIAAETYGLKFVEEEIEDRRGNTTRFAVVGKEMPRPSGNDLTSAAFTVSRHQPGALHRLLEPFARNGVNLASVQSRPMKGKPWEYVFFIDLEGHESGENVGQALDEAAAVADSYKILGSFPRASAAEARPAGRRQGV